MKIIILLMMLISGAGLAELGSRIERESVEWCDIWVPSPCSTNRPRVLFVGDSITKDYYGSVCEQIGERAVCVKFATSSSVADPAFHKQLEAVCSQYRFSVVHFNNGLHGFDYTEEEYREGYELALRYIRKTAPSAKLILALSTPLRSVGGENSRFNSKIDERNRIVQELAIQFGCEVNNLHSITDNHPEYYRDVYHYKPEAIALQASLVSKEVGRLLDCDPAGR